VPDFDPDQVIQLYSRIFFACHTRHVRDPESATVLSANQASILSHLDTVEPTALAELASHMGVTPSTMSIAVDRLVRQGYITRDRSPDDRRVRALRLTEAGERIKRSQKVLDPPLVTAMLERLPPPERTAALHGLALLARAANEQIAARRDMRRGDPGAHGARAS
jgi:DNA-binding MarR family transcriptional regulator